jgi:hypothetical protein
MPVLSAKQEHKQKIMVQTGQGIKEQSYLKKYLQQIRLEYYSSGRTPTKHKVLSSNNIT